MRTNGISVEHELFIFGKRIHDLERKLLASISLLYCRIGYNGPGQPLRAQRESAHVLVR